MESATQRTIYANSIWNLDAGGQQVKQEPTFEIEAKLLANTSKALLIEVEEEEIWIPLSQLVWSGRRAFDEFFDEGDLRKGAVVGVEMTEWIAKAKGLV